jgi:hypothetical protein
MGMLTESKLITLKLRSHQRLFYNVKIPAKEQTNKN